MGSEIYKKCQEKFHKNFNGEFQVKGNFSSDETFNWSFDGKFKWEL